MRISITLQKVFIILIVLSLALSACGGAGEEEAIDTSEENVEVVETAPEEVAEPAEAPTEGDDLSGDAAPAETASADWLVMMYMDADDKVLEEDIFTDLNEVERVGSTDRVQLVAQIDRYQGGFDGDGDWTTAKRFYITQDPDLSTLNSQEIEDLGEVNMADGQTLVDFVEWAVQAYPAQKYALILSDHGMGWPGGYFDPDPGGNGADDLALAEMFGDGIWLMELDSALATIQQDTGIEQFELIGFDACLMAQLEVFSTVAKYAKYSVASEEVEPSLGWAYASFLMQLAFAPEMEGAELASAIVDTYIAKDERITDDEAREEFAAKNFTVKSVTAEEAAAAMSYDVTLTAVDLSQIPTVVSDLDYFAYALAEQNQDSVAEARAYAQPFENVFDENLPSPYIDLGNFASILLDANVSENVNGTAQQLLSDLGQAVVSEKHGDGRPGATGIAIYFPVYDLYAAADNLGYKTIASTFVDSSQWDEYLDFHFTNQMPTSEEWNSLSLWAPEGETTQGEITTTGRVGAEPITVAPVTISADVATVDQPVTLETTVTGKQIAYIYIFIGRVSDDGEKLTIEDMDFLDAGQTKEVGGVDMPDWGGDEVAIQYDFTPIVYGLNDGSQVIKTLFMPDEYGKGSATYTVEGIYSFADGSPDRYAQLLFMDGELQEVIGFTGSEGGAPHEITPTVGDQFTILEQGFNLSDTATEELFSEPSETVTFGETNFTWEEIPADSGNYVVGFIAEDFDGNQYAEFQLVEVQNQ